MKRLYFLPAACLLLALPFSAQENLKNENLRTLSADSILTGDARMDSLRGGLHHERGPFVPDV